MPTSLMHEGEIDIDERVAGRLIRVQFPRWADRTIRRVPSSGTEHALFRLGDDLVMRLPRIGWATQNLEKESEWLPRLAPHLPLEVPLPVAVGEPGEGYPFRWIVCRWIDGEESSPDALVDQHRAALDLAAFIHALQRIDAQGAPHAGRGVPLATRDGATRAAIKALEDEIDVETMRALWEASLRVPAWDRPAVWLHGDLLPANLLLRDGQLCGVIDFAGVGVGDPASDLIVAWNLLTAESRGTLRDALGVDDATWERGRGWALSQALIYIPYYLHTNPAGVAVARRAIGEILIDLRAG